MAKKLNSAWSAGSLAFSRFSLDESADTLRSRTAQHNGQFIPLLPTGWIAIRFMPIPKIDTTEWQRSIGQIAFDLTTMSFNGLHAGSSINAISKLGQPDVVDRGVLCYFELGITILTNTEIATYFYLYARDGSHGFSTEHQEHEIGTLGGPPLLSSQIHTQPQERRRGHPPWKCNRPPRIS